MSALTQKTGGSTYNLNGTLTLIADDFIEAVTIVVNSGTCTVTGPDKFRGVDSSPIVLPEGRVLTLSGKSGAPLVGWTFTGTDTQMILTK